MNGYKEDIDVPRVSCCTTFSGSPAPLHGFTL